MSNRDQDPNFIEIVRELRDRVKVLETTQNNAVKRNDIRLSDTIVRADSPNDQLCLENLVTKQIVCIGAAEGGDPAQFRWTWVAEIAIPEDDAPFLVERDTIAREIVIAQPTDQMGAGSPTLVCVTFQTTSGEYKQLITLASTDQLAVKQINIPVKENDIITFNMVSSSGPTGEVWSVFVRFGTPTAGATSLSDECAQ